MTLEPPSPVTAYLAQPYHVVVRPHHAARIVTVYAAAPTLDFACASRMGWPLEKCSLPGMSAMRSCRWSSRCASPASPRPLPIGCGEGGAFGIDIVSLRGKFFGLLLMNNGYGIGTLSRRLSSTTTPEHDDSRPSLPQEILHPRLQSSPRSRRRGCDYQATPHLISYLRI